MFEYGVTNIHPVAVLATLCAGVFLVFARRSQAVLPVVLVACLIPVSQRLVVATLDFNMIRILILFGWLRLLVRGEVHALRLNGVDLAFLAWIVLANTTYALREGTASALVFRLGQGFDALGVYFLFRMLLRQPADTVRSVRYMTWCAAIVAVGIAIEWSTGRNLFAVFGGVPEFTWVRDGRLRCQGAFSHPIMAGAFGATLFPIFVGMWFAFPRRRREAMVGAVSAVLIAAGSSSSGPATALVSAMVAWGFWPLRRHVRALRWGMLVFAIVLHFAREKPIWHLAARLSSLIGGEGYHRYLLIDAFVTRWREWFLAGGPTSHWGFLLWDTTNQYVQEGVTGGILTLIAFIAVLTLGFRAVGVAGKAGRRMLPDRSPRTQRYWCWGLGGALTAHCVAFMGVSYWGQIQFILYLFLCLIAAEYAFAGAAQRAWSRQHAAARVVPPSAFIQEPAES